MTSDEPFEQTEMPPPISDPSPTPEQSGTSHALRSKASVEWFSPAVYVEAARDLMGTIDLDPASCAEANQVVRADRFHAAEDSGLERAWNGCVFLNPPGGLVREFWTKLVLEWSEYRVEQAIWIGYSLEQLQTLQRFEITPLDFSLCFPRRRIAFDAPVVDGVAVKRSPTHANYIAYLPPRGGRPGEAFVTIFGCFGRVTR